MSGAPNRWIQETGQVSLATQKIPADGGKCKRRISTCSEGRRSSRRCLSCVASIRCTAPRPWIQRRASSNVRASATSGLSHARPALRTSAPTSLSAIRNTFYSSKPKIQWKDYRLLGNDQATPRITLSNLPKTMHPMRHRTIGVHLFERDNVTTCEGTPLGPPLCPSWVEDQIE